MTSASAGIRSARPADRDAVLGTVHAADLLPPEGLLEVAAELDAFLDGTPTAGRWWVDGDYGTDSPDVTAVAFAVPERMTDGAWNLLMLAVHPDHQGRGRGTALVSAVEHDLRRHGARLLVVETSGVPAFAGQRRFYERLGYLRRGWIEDFFQTGDAKVVYAKALIEHREALPDASAVRAARPADLAVVLKLAVAFYAEDEFTTPPEVLAVNLRNLITSAQSRVAVVSDPTGDTLIAFAVTTTSFGLENGYIAELEDLYVAPDFRRTKIGTKLIEDSVAWARERDCTHLEVVIAPNGRNVDHLDRYYSARGFTDDGRRLRNRRL